MGVPGGVIDVHLAGSDAARDPARAFQVRRLDMPAKAVDGVVGDGDRVIFRRIGDDAQYRPENLLLRDAHVGRDVGKYGGPREIALAQSFGTTGKN